MYLAEAQRRSLSIDLISAVVVDFFAPWATALRN
jgi:hypothetical protein